MSTFEIREANACGALIKTVEADNCFRAVEAAFPGKTFIRETGWGGGSGTWKIRRRKGFVWVGPATTATVGAAIAAKTKRKAKAK